MSALADAVVTGESPRFDPFTGTPLNDASSLPIPRSPSATAGLEAPRYCQICGRRMVVRIHPMSWTATCLRHGDLESSLFER